MFGERETMLGIRKLAAGRAARAHYSVAVAFRGAPVEKQVTLKDCLSQSLAHRRVPEGPAEEIILPRAVGTGGIEEWRLILRVCEFVDFVGVNGLLAGAADRLPTLFLVLYFGLIILGCRSTCAPLT
jgi:hypothetical protein